VKRSQIVLSASALFVCSALTVWSQPGGKSAMPAYKDPHLSVEKRVEDLLGRMTLEEKAAMLAGAGWMETEPNVRLGIPSIKMADGPLGVRSWHALSAITNVEPEKITSTAFPAGIAMAATWDHELVEREGRAIGQQVKALGRDMILAPTVNIARVPLWGRNFEGYGEDPYLASRMAVAFIRGVQGEGVIATAKHFTANNQEFERHRVDEKIDERTLHEIYLPAFRAAVEDAGVWAVMSAYNKVNGMHCAENSYLLRETLKDRWGFKGFVVSDWGGTYSTSGSLNAGLDLEMPGGQPFRAWFNKPDTRSAGHSGGWLAGDNVLKDVAAGKVGVATVEESVRRLLRVMFEAGLFQRPHVRGGEVETAEHRALAYTAAVESIVLLKNRDDVLPLDTAKIRTIAVIGPNAAQARTGGGGSSHVRPSYAVSPLGGIRSRAGDHVHVQFALGTPMEGENAGQDTPGEREHLRVEAAALAAKSDVAVVVVGYAPELESEGFDRRTLALPAGQDELIEAVAAANRHTIVVVNAGSPVAMGKWLARVPAVLDMWYGGQAAGNALAAILFGDASPSGKLPVTFPREWNDSPASANYPGTKLHVEYAEGIYVGYRYFDTRSVDPLFPFGHGLSYTKFDYTGLKITPEKTDGVEPVEITLTVRNSGTRAGAEVVQLYVRDVKACVDRPAKELKAFRRVHLDPGQSQNVRFTIDRSAMSFYSSAERDLVAEPGAFEVLVAASSRDIRLRGNFELVQQRGPVRP
jgi:beta-glucosidase